MNSSEMKFDFLEVTYKNQSSKINLTSLKSLQNLKEELKILFKIREEDEIEILFQNDNQTERLTSISQLISPKPRKLMVYDGHIAEIAPKQDSSKDFFLLDDKEPMVSKYTMDQYIQVEFQENREMQTQKIDLVNQSVNTVDLSNICESLEVFKDFSSFKSNAEYEIKKAVSELVSSNHLAQIYFEKNGNLNELVNQVLKEKFEKLSAQLEKANLEEEKAKNQVIEENKSENEKIRRNSINEEKKENQVSKKEAPIFEEKCHKCLKMPLIGCKFLCLFCEDFVVCESCEISHQHPCVKVKNHVISELPTINKLVNYSNIEIKRKSFFEKTKDFIFGSSHPYKARISLENNVFDYHVRPNSEFAFKVYVENLSNCNLPMNTFLLCLNTRDLNFLVLRVEGYFRPGETVSSIMKSLIPDKVGNYKIRLVFFHHSETIECDPVDIRINVGIDENEFVNEFFKNEEKLANFSNEQKAKIFFVMNNELSTKNATEIALILQKYNWIVDYAIDELSKDDENIRKVEENNENNDIAIENIKK